jgi:hypothetical protein
MKQAAPARDPVIYLGNDFMTMQNTKPVVDDGLPTVVDTPPSVISDTPPSPAHDRPKVRSEPDPNDVSDATADA